MESLPGYDNWLTSQPEPAWGRCPTCKTSQEDCEELGDDLWECPECGTTFTNDEGIPSDPREDEPDLDERSDRWA
jgi:rubredoxin